MKFGKCIGISISQPYPKVWDCNKRRINFVNPKISNTSLMLPVTINTRYKIFKYYTGFSFFIFIWISDHAHDREEVINHEKIHFYQQLELLFVFHWLLYLSFYILYRVKGYTHDAAYRRIPFEKEAYEHERTKAYLLKRKFFYWLKYC